VNYFNNYCTSNYHAIGLISLIGIIIVSSLAVVLVWNHRRHHRSRTEKIESPKEEGEHANLKDIALGLLAVAAFVVMAILFDFIQ
jgi:ABC-type Fe3+ transport system permease subunit